MPDAFAKPPRGGYPDHIADPGKMITELSPSGFTVEQAAELRALLEGLSDSWGWEFGPDDGSEGSIYICDQLTQCDATAVAMIDKFRDDQIDLAIAIVALRKHAPAMLDTIAAQDARIAEQGWRDIASAPIDRGEGGCECWLGYFGDRAELFGAQGMGHLFQWPKMVKALATWSYGIVQPTHWRPLPAPPTPPSEGEGA